jgi:myo-inositol-1(or 4)-monophosphatase
VRTSDDRFLGLAIAAAKEAGRIQVIRYGRRHEISYKGEIDPVTEVDKLCEVAIVEMISRAFPDHDILSEETFFERKGSPWKWIIDPIDGTTNYIHEYPCFCVSIGLEVEGEMRLGVVYNPLLDELFQAEKGTGAFFNGRRVTVSRRDELNGSFLCTGFPYDVREQTDFYLKYFKAFITRSFALRRPGSAVLDLCYVAAGRFDGFWEMKLRPWDVAAASLMVTEAGGKVTDFAGNPHSIYSDELLASNGFIHEEMVRVMREVADEKDRSDRR